MEHHRALALFARALVGRHVELALADEPSWPARYLPLDLRRLPVVTASEGAFAERWRARAIVLHQAVAHEQRSELRFDLAALGREHPLMIAVLAIVEDRRVDALTRSRYPGACDDLDRMLAETRQRPGELDRELPDAVQNLWRATLGAGVESGTQGRLIDAAIARVDSPAATLVDSYVAAQNFCRHLDRDGNWIDPVDAYQPPAASSEEVAPGGRSLGADAGQVDRVEPAEGIAGGDPVGEGGMVAADSADDDSAEARVGVDFAFRESSGSIEAEHRVYFYDEWDHQANANLVAWCRVVESRLRGDDHEFIAEVRAGHRELRADLRRRLARLRVEQMSRVAGWVDGDELDLEAIVAARSDHRAGAPAQDRVYVRRDPLRRDVAVALLVDLSASTSSPAHPQVEAEPQVQVDLEATDPLDDADYWAPTPPTQPPRQVIDVAKEAVALLGDALAELGDPFAIYGFSGTGRAQVEFLVAKDFNDRVRASTWAAVAAMRSMRYTRMGAAIRHSAAKLAAHQARSRLLIVVSDGYPQDIDYGPDPRDRDHGLYDSARAIVDAAAVGVDTYCLTIDPAGHDYLRKMCPPASYLVIEEIEDLPAALSRVYVGLRSSSTRGSYAGQTA